MLKDKLKSYNLILASGSPRRQQFLKDLGLDFSIKLHPIDEVYPNHLQAADITDYLAKLKATPFKEIIAPNNIVITSDTIVWHNNITLGKPKDVQEAFTMLKKLSNDWHEVITSVCFTTATSQKIVNCTTNVRLKNLSDEEIEYYVNTYKPLDKAGAYGIQEWFGFIAIEEIQGSYNNVVGLPTHLVYKTLQEMV